MSYTRVISTLRLPWQFRHFFFLGSDGILYMGRGIGENGSINLESVWLEQTTNMPIKKNITADEAEKSAIEWFGDGSSIMKTMFINAVQDHKQHRDIGKWLASASELVVLPKLEEWSGRKMRLVVGKSYDAETNDGLSPYIRVQIKFRMAGWHFETTRRNSAKNSTTNGTGHIAYRKDEFDMLAIFVPSPTFGISGSQICCIPVDVLINPKKKDQLVPNIPVGIRKVYTSESKTLEVIRQMLQRSPSPLD